ncbi:hypothetical protein [Phaeovulum sp.]|uniref:hypothetical protein n=1 Tax=Phaeovulum sp. TaxID=2934796 RepID=UPI0039E3A38A
MLERSPAYRESAYDRRLIQLLKSVLDGFDTLSKTARFSRRLDVAGTTFEVCCNDHDYLEQAERALATRPGTDGRICKIAVISADDLVGAMPVWTLDGFHERQWEAVLAQTSYRLHYFENLEFWQVFDVDRGIGVQWMKAKDALPAWDSGSPLRNFVQWRLGTQTASLLHGGTLALSESGVLLAGEGGAGKSSTVLAGIFGGLQSVGDDYVLVDVENLVARPVFDTLKQDEKGLRRLGQWQHPLIPKAPNWQGKHQFYMPDVVDGGLPSQIELKAIVLPELTYAQHTSLIPTTAKEAFLALAPSGVTQIHCDRARLFHVAGRITRALPAYRLRLGTQPDEIVQVLRTFLEAL